MSISLTERRPLPAQGVVHSTPRAAYIHVPFCRHRCGYCNFTLVAGRDELIGDYLRAIELELATLGIPREVDTLYFGGGTPTHLSPRQFRVLATAVLKWHPLASGYEWTVEANPADIDPPMIDTLSGLGVTRLSLGGQSFRTGKLRLLERDHEAADIERAALLARRIGMQVSLDLIFATPDETLAEWQADLERGDRARAGTCFDVWPDVRTRRRVLDPKIARRVGGSRRGFTARYVRARHRSPDRRRLRTLRSVELRPARLPVAAQPGVLVGRRILRGRPGRRTIRERHSRIEPSQHHHLFEERARRRITRFRARRVIGRSAAARTVGIWPAADQRRIAK